MRQDRKTRYTRMVLQDNLIELMKEKPIAKITIKELCERADINRTTFYAHFSDQYDLLRTIEDETLSWMREAAVSLIGEPEKNETMKLLEGIFQYLADNSKHLQVLMSEQGDIDFQKQLFTLIYQLCGIDPSAGHKDHSDGKELYFVFVVNGSVGLVQHWLKNGLNRQPGEIAQIIHEMASPIIARTSFERGGAK